MLSAKLTWNLPVFPDTFTLDFYMLIAFHMQLTLCESGMGRGMGLMGKRNR